MAGTLREFRADQMILGHFPILLNEKAQRLLSVGFGSGESTACMTRHGIEQATCVEIAPEVVDFALTGTLAGLAESGSLVLWPDDSEPRLMSLVPPLHIALLDVERLHENFAALIAAHDWAAGMPSNALLISGPSKTADIEFTLVFGVHGPKELIVIVHWTFYVLSDKFVF